MVQKSINIDKNGRAVKDGQKQEPQSLPTLVWILIEILSWNDNFDVQKPIKGHRRNARQNGR